MSGKDPFVKSPEPTPAAPDGAGTHGDEDSGDASNVVLKPNKDETATQFITRALRDMQDKFPNLNVEEGVEKVAGKRRREYKSQSETFTDDVRSHLKDLERSTRVSFLLTLNPSMKPLLLQHFMGSLLAPESVKSWLRKTASDRIKNNCATWKYRLIENLLAHVENMASSDAQFKHTKQKDQIQVILKYKFNFDDFTRLFDFTDGWIDLPGSSKKVKTWCMALYVELTSFAKMHYDWMQQSDKIRLAASQYNRRGFSRRIQECTSAQKWKSLMPGHADIKLTERVPKVKKSKHKHDNLKSPDDDDHFFCPIEEESDHENPT